MKIKYNNLLTILFAFIIIASICVSFTMEVSASTCPLCAKDHDFSALGGMQQTAFDMAEVVYGGSSISDDLRTALRFDTRSTKFSTLWNRGKDFYDSLAILGNVLCLIYGFISLYEKVTQDQHSAEHIFKLGIKVFLGMLMISIGYDVVEAGLDFASGVFGMFEKGTTGMPGANNCMYDQLVDQSFLEPIGSILSLFIPWLTMLAATIALHVVVWARILDIMVRTIFSPIGMADLMHTGINGNGFTYLKKLVSSALQGSVLFGSMKAYSIIVTVTQSLGASGWMVTIILSFSLISILFKAKNIADDMLGL